MTHWLTPEQQADWRAYVVGTTLLMDVLDRELRQAHGLSLPEYEILVRLSEAPHRTMRMAQLADSMRHSRSRITHTVTRMERSGLVRRQASAEDRRGVEAAMTDKGWELLVEAAPTHVNGVREHFVDVATAADYLAMGRVMNAVSDALLAGHPEIDDIRAHD